MDDHGLVRRRRRSGDLAAWAAVPALGWTAIFFAVPLGAMLMVSLWQRSGGMMVPTWTFDNYVQFFSRGYLFESLVNSLEVTGLTIVISVVLAYPLAYVLAYWVPRRWQRIALILAILPFWTPYVIRSYSWLLILSEKGMINWTLLGAGVVDDPLEMSYSRGATILGFVHFFTMVLTVTIYANLVQISRSYRAAAADLGASRLQVFLRVTLPLSLPGVAVGAFLTLVICIGDFITPRILGGGSELLVPQAIMLQIERSADFPMASAMSMILMAVVTVIYVISAKHLRMDRV